jgi:transcriptional regulator with XRE-family HTH domain
MLQRELAEASGVSLRTVTRLEDGGRAGLDTARRLAQAFDVTPTDLISPPTAE